MLSFVMTRLSMSLEPSLFSIATWLNSTRCSWTSVNLKRYNGKKTDIGSELKSESTTQLPHQHLLISVSKVGSAQHVRLSKSRQMTRMCTVFKYNARPSNPSNISCSSLRPRRAYFDVFQKIAHPSTCCFSSSFMCFALDFGLKIPS